MHVYIFIYVRLRNRPDCGRNFCLQLLYLNIYAKIQCKFKEYLSPEAGTSTCIKCIT